MRPFFFFFFKFFSSQKLTSQSLSRYGCWKTIIEKSKKLQRKYPAKQMLKINLCFLETQKDGQTESERDKSWIYKGVRYVILCTV